MQHAVLEFKIFEGFYHNYMGVAAILAMLPGPFI